MLIKKRSLNWYLDQHCKIYLSIVFLYHHNLNWWVCFTYIVFCHTVYHFLHNIIFCNRNVLTILPDNKKKHYIGSKVGTILLSLQLPKGLKCTQCILQVNYLTQINMVKHILSTDSILIVWSKLLDTLQNLLLVFST